MAKSLLKMWETQVLPLGREDPLEEKMATVSSILARKSHGQRSRRWGRGGGYSPWGCEESDVTEQVTAFIAGCLQDALKCAMS